MPNLTGLTTGTFPDGKQRHNRLYVWTGRDRMRKYDGENWRNAGIANSGSSGASLAANGTGLYGTYYYYIVPANQKHFLRSGRVVCGGPYTRLGPITLQNQGVRISSIPGSFSADAQVTHFRIYRNKNGFTDTNIADEEQDFFYVGSVAVGTTTYDDTTADDALDTEIINFRTEIPPTFEMGEVFGERLFGAGFDPLTTGTATVNASTTLIDFSGVTIPDGVVGCFFQVDGDDARYTITARNSSTQITLSTAFVGALSGGTYSIYRDPSVLYLSEWDDFDAWGNRGEGFRNRLLIGGPMSTERIRAMKALDRSLYVFTETKIYRVWGQGPDQTAIKIELFFDGIGCVGPRAIWSVDNTIYFLSLRGPMAFTGTSAPVAIGEKLGVGWIDGLNADQLKIAAVGSDGRKVWFAVPEGSNTENSLAYVYDRLTDTWWQENHTHPMCYWLDRDSDGKPALFYGQGEFVVQTEYGATDGSPGGTVSGTSTSDTTTTLTDSGASFYTTGAGLKERYVHIFHPTTKALVGSRRISSNTSTALTWLSTGAGGGTLTIPDGSTYKIAPVYWYWRSKTFLDPVKVQRPMDLHITYDLQGESPTSSVLLTHYVDDVARSNLYENEIDKVEKKYPINCRGHAYAVKLECRDGGNDVAIRSLALEAPPQESDK